jgi:hypothetical protein
MATNNNNLKQFNVQHYAGPVSELPAKLPFGDYYFAEDIEVLYKYNYQSLPISIGGGTNYDRAESFSQLSDGDGVGSLAYVNSSEGTAWLPGSIGGNYYPSGWYLWTGTIWKSDRNSIASQLQTNVGSLNAKEDKVSGYSLTKNNLTDALKALYDGAVSWISTNGTNVINHLSSTSNPHSVTKAQVGLPNVDNTSDLLKPVNNSTQLSLNEKQNKSDDLIISIAGKQDSAFSNNVFTFTNTSNYTNNTKTLTYTGDTITSAQHLFRYESQDWSVNYTYTYATGVWNGVTKTITKS